MVNKKKILIVNLFPPTLQRKGAEEDATEMFNLISSLGDAEVVDMIHQRGYPDNTAYIGTGKAEEVSLAIEEKEVDIVALNGIAKPRQLYNLWKIFYEYNKSILVWDRVDLILEIFSKHAHTSEAKLQIELAQMRHMGPKIYGMGMELSQQAGGIGTRGIGETNVELMKRHWKDAMRLKHKELLKLTQQRERQIQKRKESGMPTLSIVGYTNAGKTTLFRKLSKKGVEGQNVLFATLDSTIGKVYLPSVRQEIFISDTIGFIKNLPPSLIEAFKSTLTESINADILIHVIDGSSPTVFDQFHAVEHVLSELKLMDKEEILVVNKVDTASDEQKEQIKTRLKLARPVFISAGTGSGLEDLLKTIEERLEEISHPQPTSKRSIKIISHDVDEEYEAPPSLFARRGKRPQRADWRSEEKKQIDGLGISGIPKKTLIKTIITNPNSDELAIGQHVAVVEKTNQKIGTTTEGIVKRILSHGFSHKHGLKVELIDGTVGRVLRILPE